MLVLVTFLLLLGVCNGFYTASLSPYRLSGWTRHRMHPSASTAPTPVTAALASTEPLMVYKGLQPDMFAHPIDTHGTSMLSKLPWISNIARKVVSNMEQAVLMDNLASSILTGPNQMPGLYTLMCNAACMLDMPIPDLYVKQNHLPTAYTIAFKSRKPFTVIHTGLLDLLNESEISAVLAHELGHLKCEHTLRVMLLRSLAKLCARTVGNWLPLGSFYLWWSRSSEYTADRASLLVVRDPEVVVSALMKLCGGATNPLCQQINVQAFLEQAKQFEQEKRSLTANMFAFVQNHVSTHPLALMRATEIVRWAESEQYQSLLQDAGRGMKEDNGGVVN